MILRGSAGRICHLENVKSYMSYLQQWTKIIKKLTLKTYFPSKGIPKESLKQWTYNTHTIVN
jgi:hypothetical protein